VAERCLTVVEPSPSSSSPGGAVISAGGGGCCPERGQEVADANAVVVLRAVRAVIGWLLT
jgi:hypothetical protein